MPDFDAIVIGGGLVGTAVAYGLARRGKKPVVLDEGDIAHRASRGNFGLVWVQSKGFGVPEYQRWTRRSSEDWGEFSAALQRETGIHSGHERPGGVTICLSEEELDKRRRLMEQLHVEAGKTNFDYQMLNHAALKKRIPAIGPEVAGASFTSYDGHANPLYTLRALHAALLKHGGRYVPNVRVEHINAAPNSFSINAGGVSYAAPRLVLGAGLGNKALGALVGLNVPVRPVRGQIIVTERVQPVLPMPTLMIRQTVEGTIMIGESREEAGFDDTTTPEIARTLAARAVKTFPFLQNVRVVRTWGALRVMAPDGLPVYEQSSEFPGAFVCTCHSGVTLAAAHALHYAQYVIDGALPRNWRDFPPGDSMFALLPDTTGERLTVIVNGEAVRVPLGFTAAGAMLLHATGATRTTPISGEGRAPYCMMGVCFECLMEINGEANQQACLVTVTEGMRINRQQGKREVTG